MHARIRMSETLMASDSGIEVQQSNSPQPTHVLQTALLLLLICFCSTFPSAIQRFPLPDIFRTFAAAIILLQMSFVPRLVSTDQIRQVGMGFKDSTPSRRVVISYPQNGFCFRLKHSEATKMTLMESFIYRLVLKARLTGYKLRNYSQVLLIHIKTDRFKPPPVSKST
jgi:hypothetical protein